MVRELVEFQLAQGVAGFFVCGWTGENLLLNEGERRLMAATVIQHVRGRVPVIVHVGCLTTAETARLAKHAQAAGATAISAKLPMVYPVGFEGIKAYYADVAAAAPGLPLYVYYEPDAGAGFTPAMFKEVCEATPTVAGLKLTSSNLFLMRQFLDLDIAGRQPNILSGMEEVLVGALAMGAHGSIALIYNLLPGLGVQAYAALRAGEIEEAAALQSKLNRILAVWYRQAEIGGVSRYKAMLKLIGFDCGWGRPPQPAVTEAQMEEIKDALTGAGFWDVAATR